jgi:tricorn protease
MKIRVLLSIALLACWIGAAKANAEPIKRTRYPAISPDGKTLAFSYQGDLWTVPSEGGRAARVTSHVARDIQPVFSPDGKSLVFASNRYGNYDLFLMPAEGGMPRRLTFNSGSEYPSSFTPDGQWVIFYGTAYGSLDIYKVRTTGGEPVRLTWDVYEREYFGNVSPDGKWIVYNHNASPGDWRRRGYEGSNNADVWLARFTTPVSEPKRITNNPSQDFSPMFSRDGKRIYYVSDRKGQVNLWSMDLTGGAQKQLTFHETDGVRIPSYAPVGEKIAYEYGSEIWVLDLKTGKTAPVKIEAATDERRNPVTERTLTSNPSEFTVSPDGKKVAMIVRGDLFVVPATGGLARELVGRSSRESHVTWMADSRSILFCTDAKGQKDLHTIDIQGQNEKAIAETDEDETNAKLSPDGKMIAFHRGDNRIVIVAADTGAAVATINGSFPDVSRGYSPFFDWSPDSKWLAFKQTGGRLEDAVYVAAIADGQPKRVSRFFRDVTLPRWSPNAKMIYFTGVAVDSANLYAIDLGDDEKPTFEEDALDRLDAPPAPRPSDGPPSVNIDFANVERRLRRVTNSGGIGEAILTNSGGTFLVETGGNIAMIPANAKNASGVTLVEGATGVELTQDGSRLYFFSGGQIQSLGLGTRDRRITSFTATVSINQQEENQQVFDEAWWLMDRYFYNEKLNGVDWRKVRAKYEAMLPYVPYKDDFYDMMAEMILELRGSHLGVAGASDYVTDTPSSTGYLGIEPDWAALETEGRFKIARVVEGSPASSRWNKLNVGEYVLAVDGKELGKDRTFDELMDRKAGKKVVLTVNTKASMDGARQVSIRPLSRDAGGELEYDEWVEQKRKLAHTLSNGRVAYMHIQAMDVPSELKFKEEFVSEGTDRDALLVDVRYNGGGNVAYRLLDILRKKPYVSFRPRSLGKQVLSDWFGDYLWGKPAALLVNQYSASNSEMMAEGFKALGVGPVVGVPTMGAVIATGSWTFMDGGTIRTPSTAVYTASGEDMELHGRQPDILVPYDPIAIKEGRDPQLEKAVQVLLSKMPAAAAANAK